MKYGEKEVNKFVISKVKKPYNEVKVKICIYFCNRMTSHYNKEKKKLQDIIYTHMHSVNENSTVHLNVYSRN